MAYWMIGNEADARDITQDVFYLAYRRIKFFRGEAGIFTYLYRIAINQINKFKKRSKKMVYLDDVHNIDSLDDKKFPIEEKISIQDAVLSLPDKLKEIIILYYFEGIDYKGIQEILKIPEGTVKSRLSRAKDLLREKLEVENG